MTLAISEVARRSGTPATTLRYYEDLGLIPPPGRVAGRRRYAEDVLDLLRVIGAARRAGFSLAEIRLLLDAAGGAGAAGGVGGAGGAGTTAGPGPAWRAIAPAKRTELVQRRDELEGMILLVDAITRCECASWAECAERLAAASATTVTRRPPGSSQQRRRPGVPTR